MEGRPSSVRGSVPVRSLQCGDGFLKRWAKSMKPGRVRSVIVAALVLAVILGFIRTGWTLKELTAQRLYIESEHAELLDLIEERAAESRRGI